MNSQVIMSNVILASVLEPIPEKRGCTSKNWNWQDKSKFEYFLIAGVNIGKVFYDLCERIKSCANKQPHVIYDLAYQAQVESLKNRNGGKINFGIIELFIPIVTAQVVFDKNSVEVLDYVKNVLKSTSEEDVLWHLKFRELARSVSKELPNIEKYDVKNLYEYYQIDKGYENFIHEEYLKNFPKIRKVYQYLVANYKNSNLLQLSVEIYNKILPECNGYSGLAADYICIGIYLFITENPDLKII